MQLLAKTIRDKDLLWLLEEIITSFSTGTEFDHLFAPDSPFIRFRPRGIPIGNLTSQLFVNVFLDPLDQYLKHTLKVKYYIRYVDDFIILHEDKKYLGALKTQIEKYLRETLYLELHPKKQRIFPARLGIDFLGYVIFSTHCLLRKSNKLKFRKKLKKMRKRFLRESRKQTESEKEKNIQSIARAISSWLAHASHAKTRRLRERIFGVPLEAKDRNTIEDFVRDWGK